MTNTSNTRKRFKKAYIEITNICNLSCPFCAESLREKRFMDKAEFAVIAPQVKKVCDYVYLHILGEPTLHPQLDDIFDICGACGLSVNLTTNGTTAQRIPTSHPALRKVSFSLHAANANRLDIPSYAHGVKQAADSLTSCGKIVEYKFWDGADLSDGDSYAGRLLAALSPNDRIYISRGSLFVWPHAAKETHDEKFCLGLRDQFGILCDGTVVPCCLDSEGDIPLGNILCDKLSGILDSETALRLYDGFSARRAVFPLCRRCSFYSDRSSAKFVSE